MKLFLFISLEFISNRQPSFETERILIKDEGTETTNESHEDSSTHTEPSLEESVKAPKRGRAAKAKIVIVNGASVQVVATTVKHKTGTVQRKKQA